MRGSLYAAAGLTIEDLQGQLERLEVRVVDQLWASGCSAWESESAGDCSLNEDR